MLLKYLKHANFDYISLILIKHFFPLFKTNYQKRNNYELAVPKIVASQRRISEASEAALSPKQIQFSVLRSEADKKSLYSSMAKRHRESKERSEKSGVDLFTSL